MSLSKSFEKKLEGLLNKLYDALDNGSNETPARLDIKKQYSAVYPNPPGKIVFLGDIHGDYEAMIAKLRIANLIHDLKGTNMSDGLHCIVDVKEEGKREKLGEASENSKEVKRWQWTGGNTYVVVLGDMVDRKRGTIKETNHTPGEFFQEEEIIQHVLNDLRDQAEKKGGKVIKICGNHEYHNLMGNRSFIKKYSTDFARRRDRHVYKRVMNFRAGGKMRNLLKGLSGTANEDESSRNFHCIALIGDWIAVHGGVAEKLVKFIRTEKENSEKLLTTKVDNAAYLNDLHYFISLLDDIFQDFLNNFEISQRDNAVRKLLPVSEELKLNKGKFSVPNFVANNAVFKTIMKEVTENRVLGKSDHSNACAQFDSFLKLLNAPSNIKIAVAHVVQPYKVFDSKSFSYVLSPTSSSQFEYPYADVFTKRTGDDDIICYSRASRLHMKNIWGRGLCFPGITYACPSNGDEGRVWRIDVGASRAFDMFTQQTKDLWLKEIPRWRETQKNPLWYNYNQTHRAFLLSRRPQVLVVQDQKVLVLKSKTSLSRAANCPNNIPCEICQQLKLFTSEYIDNWIQMAEDDIYNYSRGYLSSDTLFLKEIGPTPIKS